MFSHLLMHTTSWLLYTCYTALESLVVSVSKLRLEWFLGLDLKTGEQRGAIRACVEAKQHYEGLWPSDALKTILPSGHRLNVEAFLE